MIRPDAELFQCIAYGILPYDTPQFEFAPVTYGCRARPIHDEPTPGRTWEVTLQKPVVNGNYMFKWGPTVVNVGTTDSLISVVIDTASTDETKLLNMDGTEGFGGDICFAFYELLKSGE